MTGGRKAVLPECNLLLSANQGETGMPTLRIDTAKGDVSSALNGL